MPKQTVPNMDFHAFAIGQINKLFNENKICINEEYQRGDIWKERQQIELIYSIVNSYSIGVIVLFINKDKKYEILDGQQRLLAINKYLNDQLDLTHTDLTKYSKLEDKERILIDAYCIFYLELKSFNDDTREEDITQTFLRLQEGTPLNKAEKINAYRGLFKDKFRKIRESHPLFSMLSKEKRFRWRLLAAEFLLLGLETDYNKEIFPNLDYKAFKCALRKYQRHISSKIIKHITGNLDILHQSLNVLLTAIDPRDLISFYVLLSYLRKKKADNAKIINELEYFSKEFMKNLYSFSMYDEKPPKGMKKSIFNIYKKYKIEARKATSADSIKTRLEIMRLEFKRIYPFIEKDAKRLHDLEQKRILFFKQEGICPVCKKNFKFDEGSAHHVIKHSKGGKTNDLDKAQLMHQKCHDKLEKQAL